MNEPPVPYVPPPSAPPTRTYFWNMPDEIQGKVFKMAGRSLLSEIDNIEYRQDQNDRRLGTTTADTLAYVEEVNPDFLELLERNERRHNIYERARLRRIAVFNQLGRMHNELY